MIMMVVIIDDNDNATWSMYARTTKEFCVSAQKAYTFVNFDEYVYMEIWALYVW